MSVVKRKMRLSEGEERLIAKILEEDIKSIKPKYSFAKGFVYDLSSVLDLELSEFLNVANSLVEKGFLLRKFYRKVPLCPNCGSQKLLFVFICPSCKSTNWLKGKALQHLTSTCEYIGFESEFINNTCPNCGQELKSAQINESGEAFSLPVDYKVYDVYYKCNSCGIFFEHPAVSAFCLDCSTQSDFNNLNWIDLYTYEPSPTLVKFEPGLFLASKIVSELTNRGYSVKEKSLLLGKSGLPHEFDIIAVKGDNQVTIDISAESGKTQKDSLLSGYVKSQDLENTNYYFVSVNELTPDEKKIAETFNIKYIESKDAKEIVDKMEADNFQKVENIKKS
ncbi:MAG: hypothetical protein JTT16_02485 [Candidatus Brockarchaeota archaeon]|nr:hypothetical protein [Candidatus Brockarchaeota archaeon]MBO3768176.1 hypothetical protein [Candidatus Brockarchaeota archaeon]